jgi:hypothetical protein
MTIRELLAQPRTIAVVGLSANKFRPSHGVSQYMQSQGFRIIPVNPNITSCLGETAYPDLSSVPVPVGIVNIFRRSEFVSQIVDDAIRIRPLAIWMQEGVVDEAAAQRARAAGIFTIVDRCILKEHSRL